MDTKVNFSWWILPNFPSKKLNWYSPALIFFPTLLCFLENPYIKFVWRFRMMVFVFRIVWFISSGSQDAAHDLELLRKYKVNAATDALGLGLHPGGWPFSPPMEKTVLLQLWHDSFHLCNLGSDFNRIDKIIAPALNTQLCNSAFPFHVLLGSLHTAQWTWPWKHIFLTYVWAVSYGADFPHLCLSKTHPFLSPSSYTSLR